MLTPAGSVFVDTNVLLYSVDRRDSRKQARACAWLDYLWRHGEGRLSWQVLHEFYANAVRKTGVPVTQAREMFTVFTRWTPSGVDAPLIERGWYWMDNAQLSYWDSLILASAERLGCAVLLTEDFQADRQYGSIQVIDPFGTVPPTAGQPS
jgi:predicted nucleic acid-binding protein